MEYAGLIWRYAVNRPLTEDEREKQLDPHTSSPAEPKHQVSLIQMNSVFLECVDKFYAWKGFISIATIAFIAMLVWFNSWMFFWVFNTGLKTVYADRTAEILWSLAGVSAIVITSLVPLFWLLSRESFRYTHYPIRFNRITRTVHVFRLDGTAFSVPWDDVFFTLNRGQMRDTWEVRGHVLADDRSTVLETFALPYFSSLNDPSMLSQWEFIRRYMEEGPAGLIGRVDHVMNISTRRETFWNGFHRLVAEFGPYPILAIAMMPLLFLIAIGRWIAMQTSKVPQWPTAIQATCAIDPSDPYAKS